MIRSPLKQIVVMCIAVLISASSVGASKPIINVEGVGSDRHEMSLLSAINDIGAGNIISAQVALEYLLEEKPEFYLAQMIYADLLFSQVGSLTAIGDGVALAGVKIPRSHKGLNSLLEEVRRRVAHAQEIRDTAQSMDTWPAEIIQLSEDQDYVVLVNGALSRLQLLKKSGDSLKVEADFYSSVAAKGMRKKTEGDKRTPVGVYFTTARLDSNGLGKLYGSGAMPLNYPNGWDRLKRRSGYGIWLHGVPDEMYNRAPLATNGCVALPNSNFTYLADRLKSRPTPVVIVENSGYLSNEERRKQATEFSALLDGWQHAWNNQSSSEVLPFYDSQYKEGKVSHRKWLKNLAKRLKRHQPQEIHQLSIFRYPGERDVLMMSFEQSAKGAIKRTQMRLYWQKSKSGHWKIQHEMDVELLPIHQRGIPAGVKRIAQSSLKQ